MLLCLGSDLTAARGTQIIAGSIVHGHERVMIVMFMEAGILSCFMMCPRSPTVAIAIGLRSG